MTQRFHQVLSSLLLTFSLSAQAGSGGISLGQTRVIFSSADKAQTLTVSNSGQQAYLVQARVQNGLDDTTPAPFIVTPPLFSLQGDSRQLLRLLPQGATLPTDQESLFYLSISAIPAQAEPVTAAESAVGRGTFRDQAVLSPARVGVTRGQHPLPADVQA